MTRRSSFFYQNSVQGGVNVNTRLGGGSEEQNREEGEIREKSRWGGRKGNAGSREN